MIKPNTQSTIELGLSELNKLHHAQLHIAHQVKRVCDDHGLEYFLIVGTLLGAVRHGGFIPWDDDMDLGMPRASYDRFLRIAPQELGPDFFVQTLDTDPGYGLCFAKIRLNGTAIIEAASVATLAHNGIFIDIFPFDHIPDAKWKQKLHAMATVVLKRVIVCKKGYTPWATAGRTRSPIHRLAFHMTRALPMALLGASLDKTMRWFNNHDSESLTAIGGSYGYTKESIKRTWLETLTSISFEGMEFKRFDAANEYLTKLYGEYLVLPPAHQRVSRHGIVSINYGTAKVTD